MSPVSRSRAAAIATAIVALAVGCGGSDDEAASPEAEEIVSQLRDLEKGEILVQGSSARVYGPYSFASGGYTLRFEQPEVAEAARLVVALESKRGSKTAPYQLIVDSDERSGTRRVTVSGKLYVHVVTANAGYELRFTPRSP